MTLPSKSRFRSQFDRPDPARGMSVGGKLAEELRRLPVYRQASQLFVDPSPLLKQARINALVDGKVLVMPGPGLKDGFYRLAPYAVPFGKLARAVSGRDLPDFGRKMAASQELLDVEIDLLVGEALCVDRLGHSLGEGRGFFDLATALLSELGGLAKDFKAIAAVFEQARLVESLPADSWDVICDLILTPAAVVATGEVRSQRPRIFWEALDLNRIRRLTPLWKLYVAQGRDR